MSLPVRAGPFKCLVSLPIEPRRGEAQRFRIVQSAPEAVAAIANVDEGRPPVRGRNTAQLLAFDEPAGEDIHVDQPLVADHDAEILPVVIVERSLWPPIGPHKLR